MENQKKRYILIFLGVAAVLIVVFLATGGFLNKRTKESVPMSQVSQEATGEQNKSEEAAQQNEKYDPQIDINNIIDVELDSESFTNDDLSGIDDFESEYEVSAADENIF